MANKITVEILGDASSLEKAFSRSSTAAKGFGDKLGTFAKASAVAAGAAGIGAVALTLKTGIGEYEQSARVAAQTNAAIKATGGAANVSAKQISNLAGALLKKSGMDDEAIQSGENMLLTFRNIHNETGKGNDIFNQATKATVDMTAAFDAMGKETAPADMALQLGKALNDPATGMSRLQRIGVTFTASQVAAAKSMEAAGNTAGAQKIILGELTKEFGGSAEAAGKTLPGQLDILKESFNNVAGNIVGAMIPAVTGVTTWITSKGLPLMSQLGAKISTYLGPILTSVSDFVKTTMIPIFQDLWQFFKVYVLPIIEQLGTIFKKTVENIGIVIQAHMPQIHTIFSNLGAVIRNIAEVVMPLIKFAFEKVLPVALGIAIPALVLITGAIKAVSGGLLAVIDAGGKVVTWLKGLPKAFAGIGDAVADAFKAPINEIIGAIDGISLPAGVSISVKHVLGVPVPDGFSINWTHLNIPKLDVGGLVMQTGLAIVHRGETFSGVGPYARRADPPTSNTTEHHYHLTLGSPKDSATVGDVMRALHQMDVLRVR